MPDIAAEEAAPAHTDKRKSRQSRLLKAEIITPRHGRFIATVRNVSDRGIGGKAPHMLNLDERVELALPGLSLLAGTVRWSVDGQFGIETDTPIALDALRNAFGNRLPSAAQPESFTVQRPTVATAKRPGVNPVPAPFGHGTPVDKKQWR